MTKLSRHTRPQQLLMHLLQQPGLVQAVQTLEPEALTKLVQHIGLEDSGELVALFTTEQLMEVFDEDLWSNERPGEEETFDDKRFALWLEVLLESGTALAARKVAEMDEDLLTLALCRQVFVINMDELERRMSDPHRSDEDDLLDKELDGTLYQEFEGFQVISRNHRTWEAIRVVLVELDSEHHELLTRLLERCCHISQEYIDDNGGLYEVLSSDEMVASDVGAAREERREQKGYVPPASATAFLAHARVEPLEKLLESEEADPITRQHFRAAATGVEHKPARTIDPTQAPHGSLLQKALQDAEVLEPQRAVALLGAGSAEPEQNAESELLISAAMRLLRYLADAAYGQRMQELAYLANVLLAGSEYDMREMRPLEAAQAALATCNLGAERLYAVQDGHASRHAEQLAERLEKSSLVKLFRVGWHVLYTEVVLASAEALQRKLDKVSGEVVGSPSGRAALALANEIKNGKPWRATPRLFGVGGIDARDLGILRALIQQLPLAWSDDSPREKQTGLIDTMLRVRSVQSYLRTQATTKKKVTKAARTKREATRDADS